MHAHNSARFIYAFAVETARSTSQLERVNKDGLTRRSVRCFHETTSRGMVLNNNAGNGAAQSRVEEEEEDS